MMRLGGGGMIGKSFENWRIGSPDWAKRSCQTHPSRREGTLADRW